MHDELLHYYERELAFLQSVEANLDTAQSPEQLKTILADLQKRRAEFQAEARWITIFASKSFNMAAMPSD